MKVLVVGSGGREHALVLALRRSPRVSNLYALPGSDAIGLAAERVQGDPLAGKAMARLCKDLGVGLAVIGPEAPLAAGVADELRSAGVPAFGPGREAARLEASKAFAKDFMRRHRIPTAGYRVFDDPGRAAEIARGWESPLVVKADGLASGKGVRVCGGPAEAEAAVAELAAGGGRVLLEERLEGPELTAMAFCDGKTMRPLPFARDHKRLLDRDRGPNTGGMGAFAPVGLEPGAARRVKLVMDRVAAGMAADKLSFRGLLYAGLMLTKDGPKVLEFNVRFGDPEAQAVLPLLKTDLLDLLEATARGALSAARLDVRPACAVSVVLASQGYPGRPRTGLPIAGLDREGRLDGGDGSVIVLHAGTSRTPAGWATAGGRVLAVTAAAETLEAARAKAYAAAARIKFEGAVLRSDIGIPRAEPPALPVRRSSRISGVPEAA